MAGAVARQIVGKADARAKDQAENRRKRRHVGFQSNQGHLLMANVIVFPDGGYRFIKGVFQYSAGVAAEPGFEMERVRFRQLVPLDLGFEAIRAHLERMGRPLAAFCACELRSPAPFTEAGFLAFNREYIKPLERWNIFRSGVNPIARSNVCPNFDGPSVPSFYAFSHTVPAAAPQARGTGAAGFVISGSGEAQEGEGSYRERTIRLGDRSPEGLREKVRFVLAEMERRMTELGLGWSDVTDTHAYTVYDIHPLLQDEFAARGAMRRGISWHLARPPVVDLDFEMDVRGIARELVI
jgi:hypothetical protein